MDHAPNPSPSLKQIQANNYRLGRVKLHGFDIAIETDKGGVRRGVDKQGRPWEIKMSCPYGYIRSVSGDASGTRVYPKAADGDAVDCFIGPYPQSEIVIAVDQYDNGKFDETKFILGCRGRAEGIKLYQRHYPRGWKVGPVTTATVAQLKTWLKTDNTKKPFAGQLIKVASADKGCLMANFVNSAEIPLWTADNLNVRHLVQDGIEGDPHVTVCYGFDNPHPDDWRELQAAFNLRDEDFKIKLGKIKIFRADDNRPKSDCLVLTVDSDDMGRLHKLCRDRYGIKSKHGRYNAHLTLAYVKPGSCNHLDGSTHFEGRELRLSSFTWSALGVQRHIVLSRPWYGFDLDGTLATTVEPFDIDRIGEPVPRMVRLLKKHIAEGHYCKILTARASDPESIPLIRAWLSGQGISELEVTNFKDMAMVHLWDDRATGVKKSATEGLPSTIIYDDVDKEPQNEKRAARIHQHFDLQSLEGNEDALRGSDKPDVSLLWSRGSESLQKVARQFSRLSGGHGGASCGYEPGQDRPNRQLREVELQVGDDRAADIKHTENHKPHVAGPHTMFDSLGKRAGLQSGVSETSEGGATLTKNASELGDPNSIGNLLASQIPFLPAGARRAGSAEVMAARNEDPSKRDAGPLVSHPIMSQALAAAVGAGGALAYGKTRDKAHGGILAGLGLGPLLAVNAVREMQVRSIQKDYEKSTSRRRLRETKEIDELLRRRSGSSRLGIAHTLQYMRDRKTRNLPALAEVNDWAVMSASPLAWPISVPISQMVDDALSHRYTDKQAAEDTHWSDSSNNPAVPLFLLASALGIGSQIGAEKNFTSRIADGSKTPFDRRHWRSLAKHITGDPNVVIASPRDESAFSVSPGEDGVFTDALAGLASSDPHVGTSGLKDRIRDSGFISVGQGFEPGGMRFDTAPILAHELGHQAIDRKKGLTRFLQRHLYDKTHLTSAVTPLGSLGAGLVSGGIGRGALLGALIGGVGNSGKLLPEAVASIKGHDGLKTFEGGRHMTPGLKGDLISAYATYAASYLAPSIIAGGVGGAISAARKRRKLRDMGVEKEASEELTLTTHVPTAALEHIRTGGLLSGDELAKPENRHLLDLARPGEADEWLARREQRLKEQEWTDAYAGPSVFFGEPDQDKIHAKHPSRRFKTTPVKVLLSKILTDHPTTRMHGSELTPYDESVDFDAMSESEKDAFVERRHRDLTKDEIRDLIAAAANPKEFWKHNNDPEGKFYSANVPHAQLIVPGGKVDPKYLEFDGEREKSASSFAKLVKVYNTASKMRADKMFDAADTYSKTHAGSVLSILGKRIANHADGQALGLTPSIGSAKLRKLIADYKPPVIPPVVVQPPLIPAPSLQNKLDQMTLDFGKSGALVAEDGTLTYAGHGALMGAALPAASLADYELRQRPGYARDIDDLVSRAAAEKKIHINKRDVGVGSNALTKKMNLGDLIVQSHTGLPIGKKHGLDFTTLSLGGSGGWSPHAGIATGTGRIVDPGKNGARTLLGWTIDKLRRVKGTDTIDEAVERRPGESYKKHLARVGVNPFGAGYEAESAVVFRPKNLSGVSAEALEKAISREAILPYSRERAAWAGIKRLMFPFMDVVGHPDGGESRRTSRWHGTYCTDGVCRIANLQGVRPGRTNNLLPADLIKLKDSADYNLVGIGLNRDALQRAKASHPDLRGMALKAQAAKGNMLSVLAHAAKHRRGFGGALMAGAGLVGGLAGVAVGKAEDKLRE